MRKAKILSAAENIEARLFAEQMLSKRVEDSQVISALQKNFAMRERHAKEILKEVFKAWREEYQEGVAERRDRTLRVLGDLYRKAYTLGKVSSCVQIERLRAKVEGTVPEQELHAVIKDVESIEDDGRTEQEYEFYAQNGCWPEEWTEQVQ